MFVIKPITVIWVRHRIDGLERQGEQISDFVAVRHRIDGLEIRRKTCVQSVISSPSHRWFRKKQSATDCTATGSPSHRWFRNCAAALP